MLPVFHTKSSEWGHDASGLGKPYVPSGHRTLLLPDNEKEGKKHTKYQLDYWV